MTLITKNNVRQNVRKRVREAEEISGVTLLVETWGRCLVSWENVYVTYTGYPPFLLTAHLIIQERAPMVDTAHSSGSAQSHPYSFQSLIHPDPSDT